MKLRRSFLPFKENQNWWNKEVNKVFSEQPGPKLFETKKLYFKFIIYKIFSLLETLIGSSS